MHYDVTPQLPSNGLTVAEVFCGGGLMAVGLKSAGYVLKWANDFDRSAVKAYAANIGDHVIMGDITDLAIQESIPDDLDVLAGGPPCQDYSVAGTGAGEDGERGRLVWTYLEILERKRPKAFVFENVKGLLSKKHAGTFLRLVQEFERIGYNVAYQVINAWDHGVGQKRERVFIVGIRKDLGITFQFPEPDPDDYRTQVLRDVIGDLPEPHGIELSAKAVDYMTRDPRHIQKHRPPTYDEAVPTLPAVLHKGVPYGLFYPDETPENHHGHLFDNVGNNPTWEHANRVAPWGKPAPTRTEKDRCDGIHPGPMNHVRKDISDKAMAGYERRGGQGGFGFRVNEWEEPSPTIFGRIFNEGKAFVHPTPPPRRFTVRECLRIQSVPDWYVMPPGISLSAQYRIVGNGVASRIAYLIGIALAEQLKGDG